MTHKFITKLNKYYVQYNKKEFKYSNISELEAYAKDFLNKCSILDIINIKCCNGNHHENDYGTTIFNTICILSCRESKLINIIQLFLDYFSENNIISEALRDFIPKCDYLCSRDHFKDYLPENNEEYTLKPFELICELANNNSIDIIKLFIKFFEKHNLVNCLYYYKEKTILHLCCMRDYLSETDDICMRYILDYFIENGLEDYIDYNIETYMTPLHYLCEYRTINDIKYFIDKCTQPKNLLDSFDLMYNLDYRNLSPIELYLVRCNEIKYKDIKYFINIIDKYCNYALYIDKPKGCTNTFIDFIIYSDTLNISDISDDKRYKLINKCIDILCKFDDYNDIIDDILNKYSNYNNDKYCKYFIEIITNIKNSYNVKASELG